MDISKGFGRWDNYSCPENAEARCNDHKEKLCNGWAIGFHSTWSIYTSTEMDFIQRSKDSAELLVKEMTDWNSRYKIERIYPGFKEDLEIITAKVWTFVSNNKYIYIADLLSLRTPQVQTVWSFHPNRHRMQFFGLNSKASSLWSSW